MKRRRIDAPDGPGEAPKAKHTCEGSELLNWIEKMPDIGTHMLFNLMYSDEVRDVNASVTLECHRTENTATWTLE